jgi:capsid protein
VSGRSRRSARARKERDRSLLVDRALRVVNSGYSRHGASRTLKSLLGWASSGDSPDHDITDNLVTLRERSRDLFMGTPLARGSLKTLQTNIAGAGLVLNAQIDTEALGLTPDEADVWEANVEREFGLWADTQACDAARTNTFGQIQALACLSHLMSGDCFVLLPVIPRPGSIYDLRVQLIEGDRVCDPPLSGLQSMNLYAGIETGEYGEPLAYWVARYHPGGSQTTYGQATSSWVTLGSPGHSQIVQNEWLRIPAFGTKTGRRNVLHLFEQERPEQRRGVPILAPVVESLKQLGRYTDAELMAAVVSSFFTAFVETPAAQSVAGMGAIPSDQKVSTDLNDIELGNASVVVLNPGEKFSAAANPGRPNTAFDGFVLAVLRQIGSALELPYELIVKNFVSSYSASRAALLEAWKMFRTRRAALASSLCQPVYGEWLAEAVARGRVIAPGFFGDPAIRAAWSGAEWYGPSQGQIDPRAEVEAAVTRVEQGFSTRTKETAELTGGDFVRLNRVRAREERLRREAGVVVDKSGLPQPPPSAASAPTASSPAGSHTSEPKARADWPELMDRLERLEMQLRR